MPGGASSALFSEPLVSRVFCFPSRVNPPARKNMDSNSKGFIRPMAGVGWLIDHPERHGKVTGFLLTTLTVFSMTDIS